MRFLSTSGLVAVLCLLGVTPAVAQDASADSIIAVISRLTGETGSLPDSRFAPRPSTAAHIEFMRSELERHLAPLGGYVVVDTFSPGFTEPSEGLRQVYTNLVGVLPGTAGPSGPGCYMIGAHLDATSQRDRPGNEAWDPLTAPAPGADDNGSGIGAVLETARVLAARGQRPVSDLLFVLFDGEEQQLFDPNRFLLGSAHLADSLAAAEKSLYGFVNLDMIGYNPDGSDSLVVLTNGASRWLADCVLAANPEPSSLSMTRVVKGLGFSDHGPFWDVGYNAVLLIEAIDIERYAPHYHKATDTVANVFVDGGSQVAAGVNLLLSLIDSWGASGDATWSMTSEDIYVAKGLATDVAEVIVGETVTVTVGYTNRGGPGNGVGTLVLTAETSDGTALRELGRTTVSLDLPPGGRATLEFPWTVAADEAGAVRLRAILEPPAMASIEAERILSVEAAGSGIVRAYVFPNPTNDPPSATLHYELGEGGPVTLSVLDIQGNELGTLGQSYDPVFPGSGVDVGIARVELRDLLSGSNLAPGLYMVRIELFDADGGSASAVRVVKFAVVR